MNTSERGFSTRIIPATVLLALAFGGGRAAAQDPLPSGEADIVFVYDNSGSMWAGYAQIDSARKDTTFFYSCTGIPASTNTPFTYVTSIGPRTIQLAPASARCLEYAGDPYLVRTKIISQAIDYLADRFPASSAGAIAFAKDTSRVRPPLELSVPGNAVLVKASLGMDSLPSTNYVPPLTQANAWLTDTALSHAARKAIIFISDGEPTDASATSAWIASTAGIPIYSIALGDSARVFTIMETLSTRTDGSFYQIDPRDVAHLSQTVQAIVQAVVTGGATSSVGEARESLSRMGRSRAAGALPVFPWLFKAPGSAYDLRGRLIPMGR